MRKVLLLLSIVTMPFLFSCHRTEQEHVIVKYKDTVSFVEMASDTTPFDTISKIQQESVIQIIPNYDLVNDSDLWVDMGITSDDGKPLYWAKGDLEIYDDGHTEMAPEGCLGSPVVWGDITGSVKSKADMASCGGVNPMMSICGDPAFDIVTARMGNTARLPSMKEWEKLSLNCTWKTATINIDMPPFIHGNIPSWIQGQWMRGYNVNGKVLSETLFFDDLLVNVMESCSGRNKTTYEGIYIIRGDELIVNGIVYKIDNDKKTIKTRDGIGLSHISRSSSITKGHGYLLISKINGNKLFLPYLPPFSTVRGRNGIYMTFDNKQESYFWSGNLYENDNDLAVSACINEADGHGIVAIKRNMMSYVRPVTTHSITARKSESYTDAERGQYSEDETEFQSYNHNKFQRANSDYVDLGLPSGILWATCNVGATKPEEYGQYFAWGETTTKEEYTIENYKWTKNGDDRSYSKYCNDNKYGKVDKKLTLCSSDDVASVKLGGDWRMPTIQNFIELIEMCDWEWTLDFENSGVSGRIGTSKQNGEIIFFPAAGYYGNEGVKLETEDGLYWSSSLLEDNPSYAQYLNFGKRHIDCRNKVKGRQLGLCIRAVSPKK